MNLSKKLECYILLSWKACQRQPLSLLGLFLSYEENEVLRIRTLGTYWKHFIFFMIYESVQKARLLHTVKLERLDKDKHSSLLGPFLSYEENEVLWIQTLVPTLYLMIFQQPAKYEISTQNRKTKSDV